MVDFKKLHAKRAKEKQNAEAIFVDNDFYIPPEQPVRYDPVAAVEASLKRIHDEIMAIVISEVMTRGMKP